MNESDYTILIVDDEDEIRENLSDFAAFKGFCVFEAGNGLEALNVIASNEIDIVISDFKMPEMNGLQMLQEISRKEITVPVVIMTAFGTMEYAIEAMKAGASDFITKPIDLPYLMQVVERVIKRSELEQKIKDQQQQLDEDLNHAATIQRCLLPGEIDNEYYQLHYRFEPMIAIGGDYLTVQEFSEHEVAVALYDVAGHGVSAALTANLIHSRLQQFLSKHQSPVESMEQLNKFVLHKIGKTYMFATAAILSLDVEKGALTVTNAGHPDVYVWHKKEKYMEPVSSHIPPVGLSPNILGDENESVIHVGSGDRIVVYTDGFVETNDKNRSMLGNDGLKLLFEKHIELPPREFSAKIYHEVAAFRDGEPDDDMTLLVLDIK